MDSIDLYTKGREWFYSFLQATKQKDNFNDFLKGKKDHFKPLNTKGDKIILDIGTGSGASFIPVVEEILSKASLKCFIHEKNLGVLLDFVKDYCLDEYRFKNLFLYDNQDKDHFHNSRSNAFDLVTASHVFYYIPDWGKSLRSIVDLLVPGGVAVIAHTSSDGFLHNFRNKFFKKVGTKEQGRYKSHCGEEMFPVLDQLGVSYDYEIINSKTVVSEENFNDIVSFMLRTDFTQLKPRLQNKIRDYVSIHGPELEFKDVGLIIKKEGDYLIRGFDSSGFCSSNLMWAFGTRHLSSFLEKHLDKEIGKDLKGFSENKKLLYYDMILLDSLFSHYFHANHLCNHFYGYRLPHSEKMELFPKSVFFEIFSDKGIKRRSIERDHYGYFNNEDKYISINQYIFREPLSEAEMPSVGLREKVFFHMMERAYKLFKYSFFKMKPDFGKSRYNTSNYRYWYDCERYFSNLQPDPDYATRYRKDFTFNPDNRTNVGSLIEVLTELVDFYKSSNHSKIIIPPSEESFIINHVQVPKTLPDSHKNTWRILRFLSNLKGCEPRDRLIQEFENQWFDYGFRGNFINPIICESDFWPKVDESLVDCG